MTAADKAQTCHKRGCHARGRYYVVADQLLYCPEHWTELLFKEGCTLD